MVAFLRGLGDPDVHLSVPRVNPPAGAPKKRYIFKVGVKMITNMLSIHHPIMKSQHFAGIGQLCNNYISKPLFKRFVGASIYDVEMIG